MNEKILKSLAGQIKINVDPIPPITMAAPSKAWTVCARFKTGIVGSNATEGIGVGVRLFCVCVVLCVDSSLAKGQIPVQRVLPTVYTIKKLKKWPKFNKKGYRAIDGWMDRQTPILHRHFAKIHLAVQFQVTYNIGLFHFVSWQGLIEATNGVEYACYTASERNISLLSMLEIKKRHAQLKSCLRCFILFTAMSIQAAE
jgi:hypothetical protein